MNETFSKNYSIRKEALEFAISALGAYKASTIFDGFEGQLIKAADAIADYLAGGKIPPSDN